MRKEAFFFDLDGTIIDSRAGLFNSFRAGLAAIGLPTPPDDGLHRFLGTPLPAMMRAIEPQVSQADIEAGMAAFRVHYERDGIHQSHLYPGAHRTLQRLRDRGRSVWIVTSKPEPQALRVVAKFGLDQVVSGVVGAGLAETDTKTMLVARALAASGMRPEQTVMVGDRHYDMIGARENHVIAVGVLWGYGTRAEMAEAGCRRFACSFEEFDAHFVEPLAAMSVPLIA